ncbi:MAG: hypothetical protein KME29_15285 [Calothrix sp. FI2-JRJ7]|jgi:hypothetical protein|nr:hypothetical protein [Calothrix sp. FI2-JRJ7]
MARLLDNTVPSTGNSSISTLAYANVVLDYFDSGAGPLPGPYGVSNLGGSSVPVSPDIILGSDTSGALSLPTGSFVTVGFTDALILDQPGNDIFVLERDFVTERAEVYVSSSYSPLFPSIGIAPFANFVLLGTASAGTTSSFDLASIGFTSPVKAVRIIGLDTGGASPGFDVVNVQALQALPAQANFIALEPQWNSDNSSLRYGFEVEDADVAFGENVEVGLYFGRDRFIFSDERIGERFASQTNPEIIGNQIWYSLPIEAIPLELSNEELEADRILTVVDPDNVFPEFNENDNELGIDYFLERKIPQIMRNIGAEWEVAASFQERWLNGAGTVLNPPVSNAISQANSINSNSRFISIDWILQDTVDTNNRAQEAFDQLKDVNYLFNEGARDELAERLNERLKDAPVGTAIDIGVQGTSAEALDNQYIQRSDVSTGRFFPTIDPLTGALGNFSFYAIPIGTAEKVSNDSFRITATGVGIYALDIFEFGGDQPLGRWEPPNQVSAPLIGSNVSNATYREYREQTGLGEDFIALSNVQVITFGSPFTFSG